MNETPISITVHMNQRIYLRFAIFDGFWLPKQWVKLTVFFMVVLGLALANLATGEASLFRVLLIVGILSPIAYLLQFGYTLDRQLKNQSPNPTRAVYTLTFPAQSDTFTVSDTNQPVRQISWDSLHAVYRRRTAIYLYTAKAQAYIIPFAQLRAGEALKLWALATAHLPKDKVHLQASNTPKCREDTSSLKD